MERRECLWCQMDDIFAILGSANINNRCRRGPRRCFTFAQALFFFFASLGFVCHIFYGRSQAMARKPALQLTPAFFETENVSSVRLLVLYSYFEGETVSICQIRMKRVNLIFFLRNAVYETADVDFVFTFSGRVPSAAEMYSSVGFEVPPNGEILPAYENVFFRRSHTKAADLCHHAQTSLAIGLQKYDHVLFMNDGVRGPFSSQKPAAIRSDFLIGIPNWLKEYFELLYADFAVGAVGTVLSHEITTHLQGWFVLLRRGDFERFVLPSFSKTCSVENWSDAIQLELSISSLILNARMGLAALFPHKHILKGGRKEKKEHMNPLTKFALQHPNREIPLQEVGFLKIGGNFERQDIHSNATKSLVNVLTRQIIGNDETNYWCF